MCIFHLYYFSHYTTLYTNRSTNTYCDGHQLSSLIMASIPSQGALVPFILPLQDDDYVVVTASLFSFIFHFHIGTMYVEQEMYSPNGDVTRTILMQKTHSEDNSVWILGPWSFRVIGVSETNVLASTIILTNELGTSSIQIPSVATLLQNPRRST